MNSFDQMIELLDRLYESLIVWEKKEAMMFFIQFIDHLSIYLQGKNIESLNEVMAQIEASMVSEDLILVADLVKYELRPLIEKTMRESI